MKDADSSLLPSTSKRIRFNHSSDSFDFPVKKPKRAITSTVFIHIKTFGTPLISKTTGSSVDSIHLQSYRPYTIGRSFSRCEFIFEDRQVSKQHCQLYFDALNKKVFIADGVFFLSSSCERSRVRISLNGVFVDGIKLGNGEIREVGAGNEVSLVCGNQGVCKSKGGIGFVVERIVSVEEVVDGEVSRFREKCLYSDNTIGMSGYRSCSKLGTAKFLLNKCRQILKSDDPLLYIRECFTFAQEIKSKYLSRNRLINNSCLITTNSLEYPVSAAWEPHSLNDLANHKNKTTCFNLDTPYRQNSKVLEPNVEPADCSVGGRLLQEPQKAGAFCEENISNDKPREGCTGEENVIQSDHLLKPGKRGVCVPPPGNKFYLNRLHFMNEGSDDEATVTLPELLHPVETLERVFIATFTSDLSWFLSYCEIPAQLPVTIACHNAERCWSSIPEKRTSMPYSDFPNLVVIYPHFPEVISFGKDRKKFGIACHHPKLFVLQRNDRIRIIITSANLVATQWLRVTNTVWWQDFSRASSPDYISLFTQSSSEEVNRVEKSDFAAQLAGFMATLLTDVPDQAHWILELAKFDFSDASGHLVASVPGIYTPQHPHISESVHYLTGNWSMPQHPVLLGSVEASLVGISHLFRTSADTNGTQLKKLADVLGKCHLNAYEMSEVILRRNVNIAADANAISVVICKSEKFFEGGCVQLGFLPRDVAKWVAPLSDAGCFGFSAYISPKEVLACALEGSINKVPLILYVSQGPKFSNISILEQPALASAFCSLVASIQRCSGLWRLHEILGHFKWPEQSETDFTFGSSSVGSVNALFLAAFSAATGKRSLQFSESEESDPDWGCWTASQESRNPSIRIIFPTIERVKTAICGIFASKRILCFSQKTWLRLQNLGILYDAIPYPVNRVGHPMHVKVARRRFQSKTDTSSFGWVYCGSHNFSAAAWGRPIYNQRDIKVNGPVRSKSVLGSKLHICNYEFGIVFVVPPSERNCFSKQNNSNSNLDDIVLPFVVPAPKYRSSDQPATALSMKEALAELSELERLKYSETAESTEEEIPDEEEVLEIPDFIIQEKEDEKAYAEKLWHSS